MSIKHCIQLFQKLTPSIYQPLTRQGYYTAPIHTTSRRLDLQEFFEDPKNLGKEEIKVGRSWKLSDLRPKSNSDLHKLWYILLKEKNMLLTMEHFYKENYILFPNPERIDKVEESMKNIETTIRERNKAYYELETGETGERPAKVVYDRIGMKHWHRMTQHRIPKFMNTYWKENSFQGYDPEECDEFLRLFKEKNLREIRGRRRLDRRYIAGLLRRFPNTDLDHLQEQYPKINVRRIAESTKVMGHYDPTESQS